jgi:NitT/TauT family transport system substrate-binding protein
MVSRRNLMRAAVGSALVTAGCSSAQPKNSNNKTLDKVTHVTGFGATGTESFSWVAQSKGFFRDAGLEVTIVPGAAGDANLASVGSGKAQFTEIDYSGALVRAGNGQFEAFRCIGAIHYQTLIAFIALANRGITGPLDLPHKTLAIQPGSVHKTLFPAYAKLAGFDPASVKWVDGTPQTLPSMLATGAVDAIGQYVISAPAVKAAAKDKELVTLGYGNYLTDLYGSVLVTTTQLLKSNPDLVRRYSGALFRGLQYIVENPDESAQILKKAVTTVDVPAAVAGIKMLTPYVRTGSNGTAAGALDQGRVARGIALLQGLGLFQNGYSPDRAVDFGIMPGAKA